MGLQVSEEVPQDYLSEVQHILFHEDFMALEEYTQHQWTNRFMHSVNVSYLSWFIARKLGCDASAAARAGLLHDFCLFDFKEETPEGEHPAFYHPKAAAENSVRTFQISAREEEAIRSHMFPLGPMPKNKEAWIITLADKVCATMEFCHVAIALSRKNRLVVGGAST